MPSKQTAVAEKKRCESLPEDRLILLETLPPGALNGYLCQQTRDQLIRLAMDETLDPEQWISQELAEVALSDEQIVPPHSVLKYRLIRKIANRLQVKRMAVEV